VKLFSGTPLSQFASPPDAGAAPESPTAAVTAKLRAKSADAPKTTARPPSKAPRKSKPFLAIPQSPPAELRMVPIPRLAAGGRWRVEAMRSLSEPMLLWFTRGQGRITVGGVTRGYGAHNAIFVPAGVMHGFEVGPQCFGVALFFGHQSTVTLPAAPQHLRIRDAAPQAELTMLLDSIQREVESSRAAHDRAARHHLGLLGVWLERQVEAAQGDAAKPLAAQRLARRYADLLERDFRSGQGVGDFARALGVTPTHLSRVCNQTCGRSASDLLHDRVIFEARKLLAETRLPIGQVSESLGFTSPAYFTRAFQLRTGKTPSAFRKGG
jgi:AraC family transcriptional regulator, transcriptional activator of pobA